VAIFTFGFMGIILGRSNNVQIDNYFELQPSRGREVLGHGEALDGIGFMFYSGCEPIL
jgi:hypothetical protein